MLQVIIMVMIMIKIVKNVGDYNIDTNDNYKYNDKYEYDEYDKYDDNDDNDNDDDDDDAN